MIDLHCHIIPQVDDGSKSIEMSLQMAKRAYECGYTGIFATSHFIEINHETKKEVMRSKVKQLNDYLKANGINIEVYVGNEVYFTPNVTNILKENTRILTLNDSRYMLIEFPMSGSVMNFTNIIADIVKSGYRPIIAHPERYEFTTKNFDVLKQAIELGALLQINVTSICGYYGSKAKSNVINLLKNNMVHLIGTDAHDDVKVYSKFDKAIKKITKIIGKDSLHEILYDNSNKILNDIEFMPDFVD